MAGQEPTSIALKRAGGLSLVISGLLLLLSLPLTVLSLSILLPSSPVAGLQALQSQPIIFGSLIGTLLASDLFFALGLAALYFVLRGTSQAGALFALLLGILFVGVDIATDLPLRYVQIDLGSQYSAATSDLQRSGIVAAYQLASSYTNVTDLIAFFLFGLAIVFVGYTMLKDKSLFGRATSYLMLLVGILWMLLLPSSANQTAFAVLYFGSAVIYVASFVIVGRRLYLMHPS